VTWDIRDGDCLDALRAMGDASIDSIVTDPPYGLGDCSPANVEACLRAWLAGEKHTGKKGFMSTTWDGWVPGPEVWRECLRVLKPGGHLLAFSGSRTVDLMGMAIRLGGFELRDTIHWLYGSGFPKSLNVSKAIDKAAGVEREVIGSRNKLQSYGANEVFGQGPDKGGVQLLTAPATEGAKQWAGWGTALKPACEPVVVARKPLGSTVAACVLEHGTGALNVDGCRVATGDSLNGGTYSHAAVQTDSTRCMNRGLVNSAGLAFPDPAGRWPPNVLLQHAPECEGDHNGRGCVEGCAVGELGLQSGASGASVSPATVGLGGRPSEYGMGTQSAVPCHGDEGTAARFFPSFRYTAKASGAERDAGCGGESSTRTLGHKRCSVCGRQRVNVSGACQCPSPEWVPPEQSKPRANGHATVKPVEVMRWLVRLVTPPGGVVLDPFCGSGTTGCAAMVEGFDFVGCEREPEYAALSRERIAWWAEHGAASVEAWSAKRAREAEDEATGQLSLLGG